MAKITTIKKNSKRKANKMAKITTLFTSRDMADALKKHYITIYNWRKSGKIKATAKTVKGVYLFSKDEVTRVKREMKTSVFLTHLPCLSK